MAEVEEYSKKHNKFSPPNFSGIFYANKPPWTDLRRSQVEDQLTPGRCRHDEQDQKNVFCPITRQARVKEENKFRK